jgi:hypothetical protein
VKLTRLLPHVPVVVVLLVAAVPAALTIPTPAAAVDLLPDMIVRESDLYDHDISTSVEAGRVHLRLANGTANIGDGPLHILGGPEDPFGNTQEVLQRVFADDGTWYDRLAGHFIFHPTHGHVHFEKWALYQLREILPGDGVGDVVAAGTKTSFCLIDGGVHDASLPGFTGGSTYTSCGSSQQGISVGWYDVYGRTLYGQNIDITDVPDGTYWLESIVDPDDVVLESDETNNAARIKVTIGAPAPVNPDPFEPNDSATATAARTVGAVNSPNLGPVVPPRTLDSLSIDSFADEDWYRFYMAGTGGAGDGVTVVFQHGLGDLDAQLLDAGGTVLESGTSVSNDEFLSLAGRGAGWYQLRVYGYAGATHPDYGLVFQVPANGTPAVTTLTPPVGTVSLIHGADNYAVEWSASDPDGDPVWVNIFVNTVPERDGNEIQLVNGVNVDGSLGIALINSAELPEGEYWVHCEATDGGSTAGAWSAGTVAFAEDPASSVPDAFGATGSVAAVPNPFNPRTSLRFELARPVQVNVDVFDVRGRRVRQLFHGRLEAGPQAVVWDGRDDAGRALPSGVYHGVVVAGARVERGKLLLLK